MVVGFVQKVCSTSLLELQNKERFIYLPLFGSFTSTEFRWDLNVYAFEVKELQYERLDFTTHFQT